MLGKLFEPYVVHVLPHLLLCFGDGNQYVREVSPEATWEKYVRASPCFGVAAGCGLDQGAVKSSPHR